MQRNVGSLRVVSVMMVVGLGALGGCGGGEPEPDGDKVEEEVEEEPLAPRRLQTVTAEQTLNSARDHHVSFAFDVDGVSRLYVMGGAFHMTEGVTSYEHATIAADGTVSTFVESPIGVGVFSLGAGLASTDTIAVATGGLRSGGAGLVTSARVDIIVGNADGTLTFSQGPDLPFASFHGSAVFVNGRVYQVGGLINDDDNTDRVVSAALAADGTLSAWREETALPYVLSHHGLVSDGASLVVIGGITGSPIDGESHDEVLRASLQADGSVGAFTQAATLPYKLSIPAVALVDGTLYAIGGLVDNADVSNEVLRAAIDTDAIGAFSTVKLMPDARMHVHQAPVVGDRFYLAGGASLDGGAHVSHDTVFVGTFAR